MLYEVQDADTFSSIVIRHMEEMGTQFLDTACEWLALTNPDLLLPVLTIGQHYFILPVQPVNWR